MAVVVPRALARFVKGIRVVAGAGAGSGREYARLPDGEVELLVRFGGGATTATIVGTRTRALTKPAAHRASTLLVRFHAGGAHPFFGRPVDELTDEVVALSEVWRGERWARLETAAGAAEVARATIAGLEGVLRSDELYEPAAAPRLRRVAQGLRQASQLPAVRELAGELGMSERQLRRGFAEVVGLSPKRFLRILRFRRALGWARASARPAWSAIALRAGYFDQAHMIAEFRAIAGVSPGALLDAERSSSS